MTTAINQPLPPLLHRFHKAYVYFLFHRMYPGFGAVTPSIVHTRLFAIMQKARMRMASSKEIFFSLFQKIVRGGT
jgi:hypothetical protein